MVFRVHAIRRMFLRGISDEDVRNALETGETIQEYLEDQPKPSRLVLGWRGSHPIHMVVADNTDEMEIVVITVHSRTQLSGRQISGGGGHEMRRLQARRNAVRSGHSDPKP